MIKNPIVSVVVPCYNQAQYLDEALQSVLKQTFVDWECIIVNDGSPDHTEAVVAKWLEKDKRFKYIYQDNAGLSAARNAGISVAEGEFILPLDSDDYFENTFIEKSVKIINSDNTIGAVSCFVRCFNNFNTETYKYEPLGGDINNFKFRNNACGNSLFRKDIWKLVGGYDTKMKHGYEDWEFWISVTERGWNISIIPQYLFNYRKTASSMLEESRHKHDESIKKYIILKHKDTYIEDFEGTINFLQSSTIKYKLNEIKRLNSLDFEIGNTLLKPLRFFKRYILNFNKSS